MSLKDVQKQVDKWTGQFTPQYWPPLSILAHLAEETGELAREVDHRFGAKKKKATEDKAELGEEMADIIFTLACLANSQGVDLDKAFERVMKEKQYGRDSQRFQRKP